MSSPTYREGHTCPYFEQHGNPYRYCPCCKWTEAKADPNPQQGIAHDFDCNHSPCKCGHHPECEIDHDLTSGCAKLIQRPPSSDPKVVEAIQILRDAGIDGEIYERLIRGYTPNIRDVLAPSAATDPDIPSRRLDAFQADIDNLNLTGREADSSSGPAAPTAG